MRLEDQVCSRELSERLKGLGVRQSSEFYHLIGGVASRIEALPLMGDSWCSAFTVAELGNLLPPSTQPLTYWISKISTSCENSLWQSDIVFNRKSLSIFNDKTEANVRAKMLIFLIENGYLKTDD